MTTARRMAAAGAQSYVLIWLFVDHVYVPRFLSLHIMPANELYFAVWERFVLCSKAILYLVPSDARAVCAQAHGAARQQREGTPVAAQGQPQPQPGEAPWPGQGQGPQQAQQQQPAAGHDG